MFTDYPTDYSSVHDQINYSYERQSLGDITIKIYDSVTYTLLGVKKFYNVIEAQLNIASVIRNIVAPSISMEGENDAFVSLYHNGVITVYLAMEQENEFSALRSYTFAHPYYANQIALASAIAPISTLPEEGRAISIGERERLTFLADPDSEVKMIVEHYAVGIDTPIDTQIHTSYSSRDGLVAFNFQMRSIDGYDDDQLEEVVFTLCSTNIDVDTYPISYQVVQKPINAHRIAWISPAATLEHYTFPTLVSHAMDKSGNITLQLLSALEPIGVRNALAQIIASPNVAIVTEDGTYRSVTPLNSAIELTQLNDLERVEITVALN